MLFRFVKRIQTDKNSIFYSLIRTNDNKIIAFARKSYTNLRVIKMVELNEQFDIIEEKNVSFRGEDPRCFQFKDKIYILDNYLSDMNLIDYDTKKATRIRINGKNLSFLPHEDKLYFIHHMKPFKLYTYDIDTGICSPVEVGNHEKDTNAEFRGGTPGYPVKGTTNQYYGYGHRTYTEKGILTHDVFKWIVTFPPENTRPTIEYVDVEQPPNSNVICDPTSVIEVNGKTYLITAETEKPWFCEQEYMTNVYEICE